MLARTSCEPGSPMNDIFLAKGRTTLALPLAVANRHGLIAGATGTGKTVTLRVLTEGFSAAGVPVFLADVKGDLAGLACPGAPHPKLAERARRLGLGVLQPAAMPTVFWDLLAEQGHPVRATISDMGPLLIARLLELNDTQTGVLELAFKVADDHGLLLLDLKDLRALLGFVGEQAKALRTEYGNVGPTSIGAIQRGLLSLASQGGERFFGEPALALADLMRCDGQGRGIVNVLAADRLILQPRLYATFLLWLLSELFEQLPEVGDVDRPKLVFFFDEAHLLFNDAPKALVDKVEQMVRLIRSKGVGVYFVTQSPLDIPERVLGQLGHRVQHALRAFTPKDQKAVRAAAETFRASPGLDTASAILELGVGEALVSLLDRDGVPAMVERALVAPPRSRLGPITPAERAAILRASPFAGKYETAIDRQSAYEQIQNKVEQAPAREPPRPWDAEPPYGSEDRSRSEGYSRPYPPTSRGRTAPAAGGQRSRPRANPVETVATSLARGLANEMGRQIGRRIVRGILGSILR